MTIYRVRAWKVTFADGSFTVIDARTKYEATQMAKPLSRLTTVDTQPITEDEAIRIEKYGIRK